MENRRGSVSVGVMVIFTLVLFIFVLFSLATEAARVSANFKDISYLGQVYTEGEGHENTLYFKLVESFLDSYQKVLTENAPKIGNENVEFIELFIKSNRQIFIVSEAGTDPLINSLFADDVLFYFNGEELLVTKKSWRAQRIMEEDKKIVSAITYNKTLKSSVNFGMFELPSFDEINSAWVECNKSKSQEIIKSCLNSRLLAFNAEIKCASVGEFGVQFPNNLQIIDMPNPNLVGQKKCIIKMTSKDKYYISKEMKNIEFYLNFDSLLVGQ